MEKSKVIKQSFLEADYAVKHTLVMKTLPYKQGAVTGSTFGVFGTTKEDKLVWCATFADMEECQAWIVASRMFKERNGVLGFVVVEGEANGETGEEGGVAGAEKPSIPH